MVSIRISLQCVVLLPLGYLFFLRMLTFKSPRRSQYVMLGTSYCNPRGLTCTLSCPSLAMTSFLLTSLQSGILTLFLLEHNKSGPSSPANAEQESDTTPLVQAAAATAVDATHSLSPQQQQSLRSQLDALHSVLLKAFHAHWMCLTSPEVPLAERPNVMQFEKVFKAWRKELERWLRRGRLAGWWDTRGFVELDRGPDGDALRCVAILL